MRFLALGIGLLGFGCVALLPAEDDLLPLLFDFRFRAGAAPGLLHSDAANGGDHDTLFGYTWGAQGTIRYRLTPRLGLMGLLGFQVNDHFGSHGGREQVDTHYATAGGELGLGIFWQYRQRVHFEFFPSYQLAKGKITVDDVNGQDTGEFGPYQAWGLSLGAFHTTHQGLESGVTFGWYDWSGRSKLDGTTIHVRGYGPQLTATLGYSF